MADSTPARDLRDEVNARLLERLEGLEKREAVELELRKQRMTFYDRLAILSDATLTLTFTALSVMHARNPGGNLSAVWALRNGWIFLVLSLICSMCGSNLLLKHMQKKIDWIFSNIQGIRADLFVAVARISQGKSPDIPNENRRTDDLPAETWVYACGECAQSCIVLAYVLLLVFFVRNL